MSNEQILLDQWQGLDEQKQAQVLAFIELLNKQKNKQQPNIKPVSPLGLTLRSIRQEIVESGTSLLSEDELEAEVQARRGGSGEDIND